MKKKGISLIVLVITIIVIVILATAIIVTVVKNNPIAKAKEATNVWNESMLKEKLNDFEMDLAMEFQERGLGSVILPSYAKEKYKEALRNGGTIKEAEIAAKKSFIGTADIWGILGNNEILLGNTYNCLVSPLENEVTRLINLIEENQEKIDLDLDNNDILPQDVKDSILRYQDITLQYYNGSITGEELDELDKSNEPLNSILTRDKNGKYYEDIKGVVLFPYFVTNAFEDKFTSDSKIYKINDWKKNYSYIGYAGTIDDVVVDENYTRIDSKTQLPSGIDYDLVLPNTLKEIGKGAFTGTKLSKIVIPSSVDTIEEGAFSSNRFGSQLASLKEIIINKPEGSIPGAPWGVDTTKTNIVWNP